MRSKSNVRKNSRVEARCGNLVSARISSVSHFTVSVLETLKRFPRQSSLDKIRAGLDIIEGKEMAK